MEKASNLVKRLVTEERGQAMTEYLLLYAVVAVALVGVTLAWKVPLAKFLNRIAQAIAKTR